MARLRLDFFGGQVLDNPLSATAATMSCTEFSSLQPWSSPDYVPFVIDPRGSNGDPEIVWATSHSQGSQQATIVRQAENVIANPARVHQQNELVIQGPTISDFDPRVPVFVSTAPPDDANNTPDEGRLGVRSDLGDLAVVYQGIWHPLVGLKKWTLFTPTWSGGIIASGTLAGQFQLVGDLLFLEIHLVWGADTSAGTSPWAFIINLPTGFPSITVDNQISNSEHWGMNVKASHASALYMGAAYTIVGSSGPSIFPTLMGSGGTAVGVSGTAPFTWAPGDNLHIAGFIPVMT